MATDKGRKEIIERLHGMAILAHGAAVEVEKGNYKEATDILQSRITPSLQQIAHEVWLRHHKSGTVS